LSQALRLMTRNETIESSTVLRVRRDRPDASGTPKTNNQTMNRYDSGKENHETEPLTRLLVTFLLIFLIQIQAPYIIFENLLKPSNISRLECQVFLIL